MLLAVDSSCVTCSVWCVFDGVTVLTSWQHIDFIAFLLSVFSHLIHWLVSAVVITLILIIRIVKKR